MMPNTDLTTDLLFHSIHFVWMTAQQFEVIKADVDTSMYAWGHGGPCYYAGRIVVRDDTLGR
jgi:hypothetical protein